MSYQTSHEEAETWGKPKCMLPSVKEANVKRLPTYWMIPTR